MAGFNLRREAAPHATAYNSRASCTSGLVSISDEKPLHMRLLLSRSGLCDLEVSISDEKPLHMRRIEGYSFSNQHAMFQSQTRSRSTCDSCWYQCVAGATVGFNLRREAAPHATGGKIGLPTAIPHVSISDEKPLHMRPPLASVRYALMVGFNLRREAAPHATPDR